MQISDDFLLAFRGYGRFYPFFSALLAAEGRSYDAGEKVPQKRVEAVAVLQARP